MFIEIDNLNNLNLFNSFYKIKCDAIFNQDDNVLIVLFTIHGNHYFLIVTNSGIVEIKNISDEIELYLCFDNNFHLEGHFINEELQVIKDNEDYFKTNLFKVSKNLPFCDTKLSINIDKDVFSHQKKNLIELSKEIFNESIFL